ncbi:hypothetical protein [Pseudarthrobacter sulfonivorans]|uniref:hypothetical protein n=1 Tax=Pseudarthrobacter sulfonivorans TaxID=121292 RepID=UPI0028639CC9|nr:hypothetical protein [Pseudarthrobacter sulfonivorans]MDR6417584.1 hypothetical protein [Pseudarthrobacter sulfonivorans]
MTVEPDLGEESAPHFGSFDGRFIGVTLNLSPASEAAFGLTAADNVSKFEEAAFATVLSHEVRHFHDFLISPRGSVVLRRRISEAINCLSLLVHARRLAAAKAINALPVPLGRWAAMDAAARDEYLKPLIQLVGPLALPDIPFLPQAGRLTARPSNLPEQSDATGFTSAATASLLCRAGLHHALWEADDWPISSQDVREGIAFTIQRQEAWSAFGEEAYAVLTDRVASHSPSYLRAYDLWVFLARDLGTDLACGAMTWANMGAYFEGEESSPAARFSKLCIAVKRLGGLPSMAPSDWVAVFDLLINAEDTAAAVDTQLQEDKIFLTSLMKKRDDNGGYPLLGEMVKLFSQFVDAKQKIVANFLNDPASYLCPLPYLESVDRLPTPPIRLITTPGNAVDVGPLNKAALSVQHGWTNAEGDIVATELLLLRASDIDPHCAGVLSDFFRISDILMDEGVRDLDEGALRSLREVFPSVRLLNVID